MQKSTSTAIELFIDYAKNHKKINLEIIEAISAEIDKNPQDFNYISNVLSSHLSSSLLVKQTLLEETNLQAKIKAIIDTITSGMVQIETEQSLQQRLKKQIEKTQRDYYLHEQMKAIQKELDDDKSDFTEIEKKINNTKLSKEAKEKA